MPEIVFISPWWMILCDGIAFGLIGLLIGWYLNHRSFKRSTIVFDPDNSITHQKVPGVKTVYEGLSVLDCREDVQRRAIMSELKCRLEESKSDPGVTGDLRTDG